jgi:hypothetical protein
MVTRRSFIRAIGGMFSGIFLIFGGRELSTAEVNRLADSVVKTGKGVEPLCSGHCSVSWCGEYCYPQNPYGPSCPISFCVKNHCTGCHCIKHSGY